MDKPEQNPTGCRYIYGDPKTLDWHFCQRETLDESAWCEYHYHVVYEIRSESDV